MKSVNCVTFDTCYTQLFLVHTCQCFFLPRGAVKLTPFPLWTVQLSATATVQNRQREKGWTGAAIISDKFQVQNSNRKKCGAVFLYLCSSSPFQCCFSLPGHCVTSCVCVCVDSDRHRLPARRIRRREKKVQHRDGAHHVSFTVVSG